MVDVSPQFESTSIRRCFAFRHLPWVPVRLARRRDIKTRFERPHRRAVSQRCSARRLPRENLRRNSAHAPSARCRGHKPMHVWPLKFREMSDGSVLFCDDAGGFFKSSHGFLDRYASDSLTTVDGTFLREGNHGFDREFDLRWTSFPPRGYPFPRVCHLANRDHAHPGNRISLVVAARRKAARDSPGIRSAEPATPPTRSVPSAAVLVRKGRSAQALAVCARQRLPGHASVAPGIRLG